LGAFKVSIRIAPDKKAQPFYVVLMENLTMGMNPKSLSLSKYDLKGSLSRRYVVVTSKDATKLDTNFLEDNNSKPVCMNYTMHRLMEIAIHNDTSFLSRHEKIDYSFLVWIDHDLKLIRVGIIDYIQYYTFAK
jgi:1-phosphatidylinositol-3-phosphate 5-kinase